LKDLGGRLTLLNAINCHVTFESTWKSCMDKLYYDFGYGITPLSNQAVVEILLNNTLRLFKN